jgi:hypothetical protein
MADRAEDPETSRPPALPADLEARLGAFERAGPTGDFDFASWFWIILLGVAIPAALLAVGWWI